MEWKKFDEWRKKGNGFLVSVLYTKSDVEENRWFVYAYIYPNHPLFEKLTEEVILSPETRVFNFHGGCTFAQWHRTANNVIASKKYGCDYNHYGDDEYLCMETPEAAREIFEDAEALYDKLTSLEVSK
jgi:hypothetical protein